MDYNCSILIDVIKKNQIPLKEVDSLHLAYIQELASKNIIWHKRMDQIPDDEYLIYISEKALNALGVY